MIELKEVVEKCTDFLKLELHESNAIGKFLIDKDFMLNYGVQARQRPEGGGNVSRYSLRICSTQPGLGEMTVPAWG